jgi:RNA polymerase sigma-70 factor, ECF subfamily
MSGSSSEFGAPAMLAAAAAAKGRQLSPAEDAVLELFDALQDRLFRYLTSFMLALPDAEEIIQETFLALFQHLQRGGSRENLKGWLFRVAHNLALKKRYRDRRAYQNLGGFLPAEDKVPDPGLSPEEEFAFRQTQARLMAVVQALPELDRQCLILRAEGLRYREIADVLDMSLSSVSVSLGRSLARISRAAER